MCFEIKNRTDFYILLNRNRNENIIIIQSLIKLHLKYFYTCD